MHIALAVYLESCFGKVGLFSGCFLELNGNGIVREFHC